MGRVPIVSFFVPPNKELILVSNNFYPRRWPELFFLETIRRAAVLGWWAWGSGIFGGVGVLTKCRGDFRPNLKGWVGLGWTDFSGYQVFWTHLCWTIFFFFLQISIYTLNICIDNFKAFRKWFYFFLCSSFVKI